MKAITELRADSLEVLRKKLEDAKAEISLKLAKVRLGQEKNSAVITKLRRQIARMKMLIGKSQ